jgi:hypothetical protein
VVFALVAAIAVLGGVVVVSVHRYVRHQAAERADSLRQVAARLGWTYRDQVDFKTIPDLKRFELFRHGMSPKLRHVLLSPADAIRGVLFEYSYTVSSGNSSHTMTQTVFYGTSDDLNLPSFSLRPEHFFHRVAGMLGYQDINFDGRPEFSRLFLLRGENEARIRAVFGDPVLEFFERHPGCCAAGMNREVLFWRPGKRLEVHELESFINEGYDLAGRLVEGCRQ